MWRDDRVATQDDDRRQPISAILQHLDPPAPTSSASCCTLAACAGTSSTCRPGGTTDCARSANTRPLRPPPTSPRCSPTSRATRSDGRSGRHRAAGPSRCRSSWTSPGARLRPYSTMATFGAPLDVSASELAFDRSCPRTTPHGDATAAGSRSPLRRCSRLAWSTPLFVIFTPVLDRRPHRARLRSGRRLQEPTAERTERSLLRPRGGHRSRAGVGPPLQRTRRRR